VHLAAALAQATGESVLLVDVDERNNSALFWASSGALDEAGVETVSSDEVAKVLMAGRHRHVIYDMKGGSEAEKLRRAAKGCDLLVLPLKPGAMEVASLRNTLEVVQEVEGARYRVLLSMMPPRNRRRGRDYREALEAAEIPLFTTEIPEAEALARASQERLLVSQLPGESRAAELGAHFDRLVGEVRTEVERA
jgi:chromosome partitioning protein